MITQWIPSTICGLAILVLALYIMKTKNLTFLIGMQVVYIKTNHREVATKASLFLIGIAVLTLVLPLLELIGTVFIMIDLALLLVLSISLFIYIYKQKNT